MTYYLVIGVVVFLVLVWQHYQENTAWRWALLSGLLVLLWPVVATVLVADWWAQRDSGK